MRSALSTGNATGAGLEAHKLKSSARAIGASRLAEHCLALEQIGKGDNLSAALQVAQELEAELQKVVDAINEYLGA